MWLQVRAIGFLGSCGSGNSRMSAKARRCSCWRSYDHCLTEKKNKERLQKQNQENKRITKAHNGNSQSARGRSSGRRRKATGTGSATVPVSTILLKISLECSGNFFLEAARGFFSGGSRSTCGGKSNSPILCFRLMASRRSLTAPFFDRSTPASAAVASLNVSPFFFLLLVFFFFSEGFACFGSNRCALAADVTPWPT